MKEKSTICLKRPSRLEGEKRKAVKAILKEKDGMIGSREKIHAASTKRRALKS